MTPREKAIVMAFTGIVIGRFSVFHQYVEEKLGEPIMSSSFASKKMEAMVKELAREDFMALHEG